MECDPWMSPLSLNAWAGVGSIAKARMIVVTFSIGAPITNATTNCVDAPRRTNDGASVDEQHEQ